MVDRFEKFSLAISEISRYWHKLASDEMEKHGLRGPHAVYFTTMYCYPEGLTAARLSELCSRDKSDVSRAVTMFEKKGLVEKRSVSYDARLKKLVLTEKSEAIAHLMSDDMAKLESVLTDGFSESELDTLYSYIDRMKNNLKKYKPSQKEEN